MISHLPINQIPPWTRILFPESTDIRVIMAVIGLQRAGIIEPVLLGSQEAIISTFRASWYTDDERRWALEDIEIIPLDPNPQETLVAEYSLKKWISIDEAKKLFPLDLAQAAAFLREWRVDGVVSGSIATTADVIRTGYYGLGLMPDRRISGEFLMIPWEKSIQSDIYTIGDSAVTPEPSSSELVEIARSLVETHELFYPWVTPRVAFLSFSTHESGIWASADKVREAVRLFREKYREIECDGPIQFDAAIDQDIYLSKTKGKWTLTGKANILIFPDLDSGNIGYKMMEQVGGYKAIGPILTGFSYPGWSDLSRGTTIETIMDMAYVTAIRGLKK